MFEGIMSARRGGANNRNNRNNGSGGNNNNNNNNEGGNMLNQLAQTLATLVGNQQPAQRSIVSEFKRLNPPTFDGATDPAIVEKWIQEMEKAFELMGSNDGQKVTLAVYQLQGSAYDWWLMEQRRNEENADPMTWDRFKTALTDKYFPRTIRVQKERDFIRLEQGDRTVVEYEAEFVRLSKYAPTLVADEISRPRRLEEGLGENIRHVVANFELTTYEQVLNKALVVERGMVEALKKKDEETKKRSEPSGGFNGTGSSKKFNNRGTGGNANKGNQGGKLQCSRCGRNHLDKDCRWNTGACFSCGEMGHRVAECPKRDPTRDKDNGNKATLAALLGPNYGRVYQHEPKEN